MCIVHVLCMCADERTDAIIFGACVIEISISISWCSDLKYILMVHMIHLVWYLHCQCSSEACAEFCYQSS